MAAELLLASQNKGKLAEMRALLAGLPFRVLSPADVGHTLRLRPTRYVPRPGDGLRQRVLIRADGVALRAYSILKRYTPFGDAVVSKLLRKL